MEYLPLARERIDEDALLKLLKTNRGEVVAKDVAEVTFLLWNVENDQSPFFVPTLRFLDLDGVAEKIGVPDIAFSLRSEVESNVSVLVSPYHKKSPITEISDGTIETSLVNLSPCLTHGAKRPEILSGIGGHPENDRTSEEEKNLLLCRSDSEH